MRAQREVLGFVFIAAVALAACRCGAATPAPVVVVVGSDASPIDLATMVCANGYAFCPAAFPDGGLAAGPDGGTGVCIGVITAHLGQGPATQPGVLECEAAATDKASFLKCGGVSACP